MIKNILSFVQFKGQRICNYNNSNIDRNVGPPGPLDPTARKRVKEIEKLQRRKARMG